MTYQMKPDERQHERIYREAEMSPAVIAWLRGMGYSVYAEVPSPGGVADHVGVRWSDMSIVFVEMKCSLTWEVIRQAQYKQLLTPLVYAAVKSKPRQSSLDKAANRGIGVWSNGSVILEPNCTTKFDHCYRADTLMGRLLEFCRKAPEGGVGGMPTVKGDGPAIRVASAVTAYLREHPGASWKEIYHNVPNHYAHAASMRGALCLPKSNDA